MTVLRKRILRQSAIEALKGKGCTLEIITGPGIVEGARLLATKNGKSKRIAVRTSYDRQVGLVRTPAGKWNTILSVDEVVVAVPALDVIGVEVFGFRPQDLADFFDRIVARKSSLQKQASFKAPVFVSLDDKTGGRPAKMVRGLKAKAAWQTIVPASAGPGQSAAAARSTEDPREALSDFFERVKSEFATLTGADPAKVRVEFRVVD
jgi:hypothetical protein